MSGGGKTSTSTSSVAIPPEVLARYNAVNARAETTAQQPFQEYGGEFVSPLSQTQQAGIQSTNVAAGQAQPYYNAATGLTLSGAQDVGKLTPDQIAYYQNPYTQSVVDTTTQALQQQFGQQNAAQQAQAIKAGGLGGGGDARARALLSGQQGLAFGQTIAPLYSQAYDKAVATAANQQGVQASDLARRMQAGTQIANLGTGAQTAGLQGAAAQLQAGQQEQQTQQALDTAKYQQFLQQQRYPFDVTQFLANIAEGTGALSGSTTTTTSPRGLFGNRGGAMTGRHAKYAGGGLVPEGFDESSMGGAVMPDMEGMGFARGGYADGGIGPYSNTSLLNAGTGIVPPPMQNNNKLMVSQVKIPEATGGLGDALQRGQQIAGMYKFGKEGLIGTPKTASDPEGGAGLIGGQGQWGGQNAFSKLKDWMKPAAAHGGLILEREHHAGYTGNVAGDDYDDEGAPKKKEMNNRAEVPETFLTPSFLQAGAQHPTLQTAGGGGGGKSSSTIGQLGQLAGAGNAAMKLGKGAAGLFGGAPSAIPEVIDLTTPAVAGATEAAGGTGLLASIGEGLGSLGAFLLPFAKDGGRIEYADGGLIPREHHDGSDGNVAGGTISRDVLPDLQAIAQEAPSDSSGLVALAGIPPERQKVIDAFLPTNKQMESRGLNVPTRGGASSAFGPYQFTKDTWNTAIKRHPELGLTPQDRFNPDAQEALAPYHANDLLSAFQRSGIDPSPQALRFGWALGEGGGPAFMKSALANPDAPATSLASRGAIAANPTWFFNRADQSPKTASQAMATILGKFGTGTPDAPVPPGLVGRAATASADGSGAPSTGSGLIPDMSDLTDKATSSSFLVPALGFLGSMLSSKSRTLAGALGEGMLGGVGAHMANQKQQIEMAKDLRGMLDSRFKAGTVPTTVGPDGKPIYGALAGKDGFFDTATQQWMSIPDMISGKTRVARDAGVAPALLGIPAIPTVQAPKAPGAPTAAGTPAQTTDQPAQPAQPAQPSAAQPSTDQTAQPAQPGAKPPAADQKPAPAPDVTKMSKQQLIDRIRAGGDQAYQDSGLTGAFDPRPLERDLDATRKQLEVERTKAGPDAQKNVAELTNQVSQLTKNIQDMYSQAVDQQVEVNKLEAQTRNQSHADFQKDAIARVKAAPVAREALVNLANIYKDYQSGIASNIKGTIKQWANQFGFGSKLPEGFDSMSDEAATKMAFKQAFQTVHDSSLVRAPASTLSQANRIVAQPIMDPGAVMSIIGQTLGEMDYVNKQDLGYIKGNLRDPGQYLANFSQNESVRPYIASAFSEVPRAKGVTNEQYAKLSRDYNFVPEGVNPKTDYGGAPITYRGNIGRVELTGPDGKKYYQYFKKGMY